MDAYGNVLYYHADAASPLAWDIDHWFPCSSNDLIAFFFSFLFSPEYDLHPRVINS